MLKKGPNKFRNMLLKLFERCVHGEPIPEYSTPVHKKCPKNSCNNYSCVSVIIALSRVYDKLLKKITGQEYKEIEQAGFKVNHSCMDHTFTINHIDGLFPSGV